MNLSPVTPAPSFAWLLAWTVTACLSCGRADSQPAAASPPELNPDGAPGSASSEADSGARARETDGGSTSSSDEGPPPQTTPAPSEMRWARNGGTGRCSPYDSTLERPVNLRVFSTEAECERSCGCRQLECVCSGIECPSTIEEAAQSLCANANTDYMPASAVVRREGCGRTYITSSNGFAVQGWLFAPGTSSDAGNASSATLVGSTSFVDVDTEPCATYSWAVGESFDCAEALDCQVCGVTLGAPLPACD